MRLARSLRGVPAFTTSLAPFAAGSFSPEGRLRNLTSEAGVCTLTCDMMLGPAGAWRLGSFSAGTWRAPPLLPPTVRSLHDGGGCAVCMGRLVMVASDIRLAMSDSELLARGASGGGVCDG